MKIWVVVRVHEWGSAEVLAAFTDRDEANTFAVDVDFYNCELLETTLEGQIASPINAIKEEVK